MNELKVNDWRRETIREREREYEKSRKAIETKDAGDPSKER